MGLGILIAAPILMTLTGIIFLWCVAYGLPNWLTVKVGGLEAEDLRQLSLEQRDSLQKQSFRCFPPTVCFALLPWLILSVLDMQGNTIAIIAGVIIQIIAMSIIMGPLFDLAKKLKAELDISKRQAGFK